MAGAKSEGRRLMIYCSSKSREVLRGIASGSVSEITRLHVQMTAAKRGEDNFRIADNSLGRPLGLPCWSSVNVSIA